ncbi:hypothetical protein FSC37_01990 [Piscinibacter aquaticus]|uniref:Class I SAM-dependent methyltransferase n=1 Tax=Piscinibacter aquaticus TaxID=392597 RepID=A0A5C6TXR1_9BURK|nr:hypothetical protein FSC37_01990 [Piscinibacter aquaticus]
MNERRKAWIDRIEACGRTVAMFDGALYGAERDAYIVQSKAVINAHYYESCRFEQARVAHCLSLGTPVISERTPKTLPHEAFEDSVLWLQGEELEQFFTEDFATPAYYEAMVGALERFRAQDPIAEYADMLGFARGYAGEMSRRLPSGPWQPTLINLGSGKDYHPGWLNLDIVARTEPDLLLDLAQPLELPLRAATPTQGELLLEEGSVELINANNVLEHVPDLVTLMGNCLKLLKLGGEFRIEVPYEHARSAWQDPTHVRALNENSWTYYTDWFWYLGWYEHRFEIASSTYLDERVQPCEQGQPRSCACRCARSRPRRPSACTPRRCSRRCASPTIRSSWRFRRPRRATCMRCARRWRSTAEARDEQLLRRPQPQAAAGDSGRREARAGTRLRQRPARPPLQGAAPGRDWWGVELMADAAATAAQHLDRVFQLDLDRADLAQLEGGFDTIVIGDLLEHVREPARLLESLYDPPRPARRSSAACPTWRTCR